MKRITATLLGTVLPLAVAAQQPVPVPPGTPVTITVTPATAAGSGLSITLNERIARATPHRFGVNHTGGGNIDVQQPSSDTVVITMTGVAVAVGGIAKPGCAAIDFDLTQAFEVSFDKPDVKAAKVSVEARVIGLLRSHCKGGGTAEATHGCATVSPEKGASALSLCVPDHVVANGDNLSVNDHVGPQTIPVGPGKYTLHQAFHVGASHPKTVLPCKAASAEFAPDPALDPLWISAFEPFHGASKKDFGFQVIIKVSPQ